ncbi:MAG: HAMP domain-containing protein [Methanomicrobiaceae archaeon]|nr:HAMP domain-containing protein [Methanomicrobiaceae archaeon]
MNLRTKVIIIYICITLMVVILIGGVLPTALQKQNLETISEKSLDELRHINFALSNLVNEAKYDVHELSINDILRTRDDSGFTTFLDADEETFRYSYGDTEKEIIEIMMDYQSTHPSVNSVYMGRESGTFVRSCERARPTAYDPRERPWYILGKENPGEVMVTDPYRSVTTPDVNIGVVTALTDDQNEVYGVVGADITLVNLTNYISKIDVGHEGEVILVDGNGVILAGRDPSGLYTNVSTILGGQTETFLNTEEGVLVLNGGYLVYYTSPELGWKVGEIIPFEYINKKINESIGKTLLFVIIALILLSVITIIVFSHTIIKPLSGLTEVSRKIAESGDLDQEIDTTSTGEIGTLARSFKAMVEKIRTEEEARKKAFNELENYRDNLEDLVAERTSELEAAKEKAESADRLKSVFIATMSHELRTPLNSIIGFTGVVLQEIPGPLNDEQKKQLGMVRGSARHLLSLINDIIDISKIEAGTVELGSGEFDLADVISEIKNILEENARQEGLGFEVNMPDTIPVTGDERRVKQVIMNLVTNAIKFTDKGSVTISADETGDGFIEVSVTDTGIGIKEEDLKQLFRAFSRILTPERVTGGTGLGLYLSQRIAEAMGGGITVMSREGEGSTFTFRFLKNTEEER